MKLNALSERIDFLDGEVLAGSYHPADPFKPHLHPLNTPGGRTMSCLMPHDHPHHKALMYALMTDTTNWWEEVDPDRTVGRQISRSVSVINTEGTEVGFYQILDWISGDDRAFEEHRQIKCRRDTDAYVWTWRVQLKSLRPQRLEMSQWSMQRPDGKRVNYHGLGLRFPRDFGGTGGNTLRVNGDTMHQVADALGAAPRSLEWVGTFDPWPGTKAALSIQQAGNDTLFVLERPFAYLALGPSNISAVPLRQGDVIENTYTIRVRDIGG